MRVRFPRWIDDPVQILFWEPDELAVFFLPLLFGFFDSRLFLPAIILGFILSSKFSKLKEGKPRRFILHVGFWYGLVKIKKTRWNPKMRKFSALAVAWFVVFGVEGGSVAFAKEKEISEQTGFVKKFPEDSTDFLAFPSPPEPTGWHFYKERKRKEDKPQKQIQKTEKRKNENIEKREVEREEERDWRDECAKLPDCVLPPHLTRNWKEFRENFEKALGNAAFNPTPENVLLYLAYVRELDRRAQIFAVLGSILSAPNITRISRIWGDTPIETSNYYFMVKTRLYFRNMEFFENFPDELSVACWASDEVGLLAGNALLRRIEEHTGRDFPSCRWAERVRTVWGELDTFPLLAALVRRRGKEWEVIPFARKLILSPVDIATQMRMALEVLNFVDGGEGR